jgi:hypothetical protein
MHAAAEIMEDLVLAKKISCEITEMYRALKKSKVRTQHNDLHQRMLEEELEHLKRTLFKERQEQRELAAERDLLLSMLR